MHSEIVQENISQTSSLLIIKKTEFTGRLYVLVMSRTRLRVNPHSTVA